MKIIVIDDNLDEALRLKEYAQDAFPDATVLPEDDSQNETFSDWPGVITYIRKITDEFAVLFLDLALKPGDVDYDDVRRGLGQGVTIRRIKRHWVLIGYTRFADYAVTDQSYRQAFDGIISKGKLDAIIGNEKRVLYVKRLINTSINKRKRDNTQNDQPLDARVVDSFGIRTFQAAFGDAAIAEIIENEAANWENKELQALTSGHSGAFMLSLRGRTTGGLHSLVIKVAQNEQVIQHEINAQKIYFDRLGPLNAHLGYLDPEKKDLLTTLGVYYRQALVEGDPLLELLRGNDWSHNQNILEPVVGLCIDVYRSVEPHDCATSLAHDLFKLTPTDIGRLETSVKFIVDLSATLQSRGFWPTTETAPDVMAREVTDLAKTWSENQLTNVELRTVIQHGDLNPGNVLIRRSQNVEAVLIDLSRLGPWHVGYDLSRLALMLRLRLISGIGQQDWMHDELEQWLLESVACVEQEVSVDSQLCSEAAYCDRQFRRYLDDLLPGYRDNIAYGYKLGTIWDLIKVISYQDISPYKRIWALIECWKLKNRLASDLLNITTDG
jgi:hypothetical protein